MNTPRRQIFLPLPSLSPEQAEALIETLDAVVAELWHTYGDDIRAMHAFADEEEADAPDAALPPLEDGEPF